MATPPEHKKAFPAAPSGDIVVLILFLLIAGIMLAGYFSPRSEGNPDVRPTSLPTASHSAALEQAPIMIFYAPPSP
jgi:hypothetical protein